MKRALLSANPFEGLVTHEYNNPRTEYAWAHHLRMRLIPFYKHEEVKGYDQVFVILPKQPVIRDTDGRDIAESVDNLSVYFQLLQQVKEKNTHLIFIQEGPVSYWQNYSIQDQAAYLNILKLFDMFLCHDETAVMWFKGVVQDPNLPVHVIPSVMIDSHRPEIKHYTHRKDVLIGGGFAEWHGGANSYLVANVFEGETIWVPKMHTYTELESKITNLQHFEEMLPLREWLERFSRMKYAVHMMPVIGAGSFSLNAAYSGVPCIGNWHIPTQRDLFPSLSFGPNDLYHAKSAAFMLRDEIFWNQVVEQSQDLYATSYYRSDNFKSYMKDILT